MFSAEDLQAAKQRENGRVGFEVMDHEGRRYWITDVMPDDRLRVMGENGKAYWFDPAKRVAKVIPAKKRRVE